ncbi:bifunctional oligoribonuclease/PAP phosphatase NrnA [candidate division WWE3 bacterium]|jgi:phosphoesterase RecJ-like protein|uniref:Bifunctional oligoribonuclease/PAP phosphatase NrnA n=1 Tax=candidate division WWE3 bacterium TaxID=2053526 RepID=A0A3A4ZMR7_UNCKA|nr:MAG: bifunctional oligoribonuclease/PAP phosphatase NrnA [candidate division WWE3 bacterium]
MNNDAPERILELLKKTKKPVVCMDSRFDFDALCAPVALQKVLKKHFDIDLRITRTGAFSGRTREIVNDIFDISGIEENVDPNNLDFSKHDLLIVLDAGQLGHIAESQTFTPNVKIPILNIDHHDSNSHYGDLNYVKVFGSACTVLYELLKEMNIKIDKDIAKILLLGNITDNGFFQYNTTTTEDLRAAADYMDMGVSLYELIWKLNFNEDYEDMKLKGLVFTNMEVDTARKLAYVILTQKHLEERNINLNETVYPPADIIKRLRNANFVFVVTELKDENNMYNVSLRSHYEHIDVSQLAKLMGGGGHKMAAGFNMKASSPKDVVEKVVELAEKLKLTN